MFHLGVNLVARAFPLEKGKSTGNEVGLEVWVSFVLFRTQAIFRSITGDPSSNKEN